MGSGNITISYAEYTRLLDMKTRIDVIDELDGIVELKKEEGEEMEDFIAKCQEVADDNFDNALFVALISEAEADCLGYDTY